MSDVAWVLVEKEPMRSSSTWISEPGKVRIEYESTSGGPTVRIYEHNFLVGKFCNHQIIAIGFKGTRT